jgi:hypothetical protein
MLLSLVAEPEPHHFGGARAGAVTRCSSGSDSSGSKPDIQNRQIFKNVTNFLFFSLLNIFASFLVHFRIEKRLCKIKRNLQFFPFSLPFFASVSLQAKIREHPIHYTM